MSGEEQEKEIIRPYVVDGIEEYDNPLPPWWVWLFNLTIAFGLAYLLWVHMFGWNRLDDELKKDAIAFMKQQQAAVAGDERESLEARLDSAILQNEGKAIYSANCASCHGQEGEGMVGPNLADNFWLHGGRADDIIKTISSGVPSKGMIAWANILGPKKIEAAAAFIRSLRGTNPTHAKAPQGQEFMP